MYLSCVHIITYYYIILHHFYVIMLYHYHIITKGNLVMIMIPLLCVMQRWCYTATIITSLLRHYYFTITKGPIITQFYLFESPDSELVDDV